MRRLVVVAIAAVLALSLAGCGGGGEEASTGGEVAVQTQAPATPPAAPASAAAASAAATDTLSPGEPQAFEPFPAGEDVMPDVIRQRVDSGQPILVFFYDGAQKASDDQRAAVDAALADYRGLIDLVSFDVGKYVSNDESGTVSVKPGMEDDQTAQQIARLLSADYLDVGYTPYIVFVNDRGYITYRVRGYVDSALLEREVLRATE